MTTFVSIHAIQTVPASSLNRDDMGNPKTFEYGGQPRLAVSSQSWKNAIREAFTASGASDSIRTRQLGNLILALVLEARPDADPVLVTDQTIRALLATGVLPGEAKDQFKDFAPKAAKAKKDIEDDDGDTTEAPAKGKARDYRREVNETALAFLSGSQRQAIADSVLASLDAEDPTRYWAKAAKGEAGPLEALTQALTAGYTPDMALFGRMLAANKDLNIDAAAAVAFAMGVDVFHQQSDYWTGRDQLAEETGTGAGMIGTSAYGSGTLYRHASVNVGQLVTNLGDTQDAEAALAAFVQAFLTAMPGGKRNSFANYTLPDFVRIEVTQAQPSGYSGAFEVPVTADGAQAISAQARDRLRERAGRIAAMMGVEPLAVLESDQAGDIVAIPALAAQAAEQAVAAL